MKLVIDNIIFAWQRSGGISVVWYELLSRMLKSHREGNLYDAAGKPINLEFVEYENSCNNKFWTLLDIPAELIAKVVPLKFLQFKRYMCQKYECDEKFIFHSSYYRTCSNKNAINVVTVHDFTYEYYTKGFKRWLHSFTKKRSLRKADYVVCISENTKADLLKFVPDIDAGKIVVIHNGASEDFYVLNNADDRYSTDAEQFIVFIGSRASYKNFGLAVAVAAKSGLRLKIVGSKLNADELAMVKAQLGGNFDDLGYIDNAALNRLYNKAFALIYPSSYEGFGLPVVEAQKSGCPVLALDSSSITEIVGDVEQLVKKADVDEFVRQIDKLRQPDYRHLIVEAGVKNSMGYSWDNTYGKYLALYRHIIEENTKNQRK